MTRPLRCQCGPDQDARVTDADIHRDAGTVTEFYQCGTCGANWSRELTFAEIAAMQRDDFAPVAEFCAPDGEQA